MERVEKMSNEVIDFNGPRLEDPMQHLKSNYGRTLQEMSSAAPVLVFFLRHLGCTFCRETLADLRQMRQEIEAQGVDIALVHMARDEDAAILFRKFQLADLPRFADRRKSLYHAFGVGRGTMRTIFAWQNWKRMLSIGFRYGAGPIMGDPFQMPAVFVVDQGQPVVSHLHENVSDRPDYLGLVRKAARGNSPVQKPFRDVGPTVAAAVV